MSDFRNEVDAKVGILWNKLNGSYQTTMTEIENEEPGEKKLSRRDMCLAMGWLIQEGKLAANTMKKKIVLTLSDEKGNVERYQRENVHKKADQIIHLLKNYIPGGKCSENELVVYAKAQTGMEQKDVWVAIGFLLKEGAITQSVERNKYIFTPC